MTMNDPLDPDEAVAASASRPLRLAIINDFEVIVRGLAALLEPYPDRIEVVDIAVRGPAKGDVDVVLVDTFAEQENAVATGRRMLAEGRARALVAYTWEVERVLSRLDLEDGFAAVVSKTASADDLVEAIEAAAEGSWKPAGDAVDIARVRGADTRLVDPLSDRELEVVAYMADGLRNAEIAERMHVSPETVKTYASRAYTKIGARNRAQAAAWAAAAGVRRLQPPA